jgi:hypothetical protein
MKYNAIQYRFWVKNKLMSCLSEFTGIHIPFLDFQSVQSLVMKHLTTCFTASRGKVSFITQLGLEKE